ncbi:uncharacterized protein N0V89_009715 [Didymosphaeria variabile]|uniref:USP8 dimerisation domain-containing protein n=1 Tax=Didymosphaeria variabile TaxID=1932322 RepID=A0A9W9C7J9_9PLEO|nr:uncharacterized protein N0V89_009715 [Didymosphaeria variabile]KAJ4348341.1 hypothetical protein N0V89_009715 [Didymosphaeria variabile]
MASLGAPLSVQELTDQASKYEYNAYIPLRNWLRTASMMHKQAQVYAAEGNDPQTYLLLYRHANLVLEHLTNHPEKNLPENRKALSAATAAVGSDIQTLEDIRPRIKKRHEEFHARRQAQQNALQSLEGKSVRLVAQELDGPSRAADGRSYEKQTLDALENQTLAAKLAQREVRRRDAARRSVRQAGVSEQEESERRTAGMWGDWEKELRHHSAEADGDLSAQLQEVARMQQNGHQVLNYTVGHCSRSRHETNIHSGHTRRPLPRTTTLQYQGNKIGGQSHIHNTSQNLTHPLDHQKSTSPPALRSLCYPTRSPTETLKAAHSQVTFRTAATTTPNTREIRRHYTLYTSRA